MAMNDEETVALIAADNWGKPMVLLIQINTLFRTCRSWYRRAKSRLEKQLWKR
jgi:hypothetical protein